MPFGPVGESGSTGSNRSDARMAVLVNAEHGGMLRRIQVSGFPPPIDPFVPVTVLEKPNSGQNGDVKPIFIPLASECCCRILESIFK
jgi:hypothetical protein